MPHAFLLPNNIQLHSETTFGFSVHQLMDFWVAFIYWLLWMFLYKLYVDVCFILLGWIHERNCWVPHLNLCLTFWELTKQFSKVAKLSTPLWKRIPQCPQLIGPNGSTWPQQNQAVFPSWDLGIGGQRCRYVVQLYSIHELEWPCLVYMQGNRKFKEERRVHVWKEEPRWEGTWIRRVNKVISGPEFWGSWFQGSVRSGMALAFFHIPQWPSEHSPFMNDLW